MKVTSQLRLLSRLKEYVNLQSFPPYAAFVRTYDYYGVWVLFVTVLVADLFKDAMDAFDFVASNDA